MKIVVRTLAVTFLFTGTLLASHSQSVAPGTADHRLAMSHQPLGVGMPPPSCPPSDPNGCQMGPVPKVR